MEHSPERQRIHYYDALNMLEDRQDFLRQIDTVEALLVNTDEEDEKGRKFIDESLDFIDETLGASESDEPAIFRGVAFLLDENDDVILNEPILLMDEELVYAGANYYEVEGRERVLFEFRDDADPSGRAYAAPFEAILRLELSFDPNAKTAIVEALDKCATESRGLTTSPDVLAASRRDQYDLLRAQAMECYEKIIQMIPTQGVSIECSKYYEHVDATDEEEFAVEAIDQSKCSFEDRMSVDGDIVGVIYLEAKQKKLPFRKTEDFTYGGVPCMVVRNDYVGVTTYIPIDAVESIAAED